jgi:hypothetical protein
MTGRRIAPTKSEKSSLKVFLPSRHDARVNRFLLAIVLLLVCVFSLRAEDERICLDATINGKPVRFIFDTGAGVAFVLYSTAAHRLGLKVTLPPPNNQPGPGQTTFGWTDLCKLDFGTTNIQTHFGVLEIPSYLKWSGDGVLGWPAISNNIFSIDFITHTFHFFTNEPVTSPAWIKLRIQTNSDLALELPNGKIIAMDSGSDDGVKLSPQKWREWKTAQTNQPTTIQAYYTPNPGLVVAEEMWADKISLGSLTLTEVPVMEADSSDVALHSSPQKQFEATLGFAALKRLDVIIDGKRGIAYLRPRQTPSLPYEHNRLGAAFVPRDPKNDDLVAHVADGSPAYEAGIRNDDVLLKIGKLDATKWRTDPNVLPLSRFWSSPAGTKLELALKRGDKIFKTTAVLRNILPPDAPKNSN